MPKGQSVTAEVGGQTIPTQVNPKATWNDGSLRHAVITVRLPQVPDSSGTRVSLVATGGSGGSGQAISINDLLATDFSGKISFKMQGQSYDADARTLLRQAVQGGGCPQWGDTCKRWLSGPLASEWIVGGPVSGGGNTAPHLAVYFHIRAYGNGQGQITRARVDTVIENDWAYVSDPHDLHYNADLQVGAQTYPVKGLTHYNHARWHHVLWWHGNPHVYAALDTNYLQATHAISNYADVTPSNSFLNSVTKHFPPMSNGDQTAHMGQTGAQASIGPLPRWSSTYAVSGDYRAFEWMLANDSAVGSYGFHYRDQQTGRPLTIADHPDVTLANYSWAKKSGSKQLHEDLLAACTSACQTPYRFNIAHQPSIGYLPYLVTGDYYYLEEMQFAASYDELWANESYRQHAKGILRHAESQVRGQAWALREISDAAFATPDSDPMKSYFTGLMKNILSDYNHYYVGTGVTPIHTLIGKGAFVYSKNGASKVALAPWQADFFTWAVGHAAEQEMPGAKSFLDWLASFQIGRMTNWVNEPTTGFCWLEASAYTLQLRDSRNSPIYGDMSEAYKANFPQLVGTRCNSSDMILRLNNNSNTQYKAGYMVGYPFSPTGFPANLQIGLAMAVDSGDSSGAKAWQLFESRSDKPDYSNDPNFAVEPRSVPSSN